jgi:hypothetical protein
MPVGKANETALIFPDGRACAGGKVFEDVEGWVEWIRGRSKTPARAEF